MESRCAIDQKVGGIQPFDRFIELHRHEVEFREKFANPYLAASRGYIDAVIEPSETRPRLIRALQVLATKVDTNPRKKHGNIPL